MTKGKQIRRERVCSCFRPYRKLNSASLLKAGWNADKELLSHNCQSSRGEATGLEVRPGLLPYLPHRHETNQNRNAGQADRDEFLTATWQEPGIIITNKHVNPHQEGCAGSGSGS